MQIPTKVDFIQIKNLCASMLSQGGQVLAQMANSKEFGAAKALIELAYGRSLLPNNELASFPVGDGNKQNASRVGGDGKMKTRGERLHVPLAEVKRVEIKKGKRKAEDNFSLSDKKKHKGSSICEKNKEKKEENNNSSEVFKAFASSGHDRFGVELFPNQKAMADMTSMSRFYQYDPLRVRAPIMINELASSKKKVGLQKKMVGYGTLGGGKIHEPGLSKKDRNKAPPKKESARKLGSSLIAPTHTGISFSILHLLSAVRTALITPHVEHYASVYNKQLENKNPVVLNRFHPHERDVSLRIQQIVQLVRLRPGDRSILETKEPLQDLVKGVLMILSSEKGPLGASQWNPLTVYEKTRKTWSWVGHVAFSYPHNRVEEEISAESWGIPRQTIVKLVSCFVIWLKERKEALKKINSLPPPPLTLMEPPSLEERFKDVKALKRISTISPSCDEIRAYFRREETLRYSMPKRAFYYTALDGKKSAVAPLKRCSGKPTVRGREHFMLKEDRPASFTILCLVRDAASRLPGSIGTRADVCILVRDSQFLVEDIDDESQFIRAVSGGLDRLHFEDDPCVRFDKEKQLWFYLHGEKQEEDFDHVGTAPGRKRRRAQNASGESSN